MLGFLTKEYHVPKAYCQLLQCSGFPCRCGDMLGELFPLLQVDRDWYFNLKSYKWHCLQEYFEKEKGRQDLTAALELSKCGNMKRLLGKELKRVDLRKKLEDRKSQQKSEEEGKSVKKCWKCGISSTKVELSKCSACRRAWWVVFLENSIILLQVLWWEVPKSWLGVPLAVVPAEGGVQKQEGGEERTANWGRVQDESWKGKWGGSHKGFPAISQKLSCIRVGLKHGCVHCQHKYASVWSSKCYLPTYLFVQVIVSFSSQWPSFSRTRIIADAKWLLLMSVVDKSSANKLEKLDFSNRRRQNLGQLQKAG